MLFSNKKEQFTNTHLMDEFQNAAQRKRSQTQEYILNYLYEILEWAKLTSSDRGERSNCIGPGLCGDEDLNKKLHKEIPGLMDMFYIMTEVIVTSICNTHQTVT